MTGRVDMKVVMLGQSSCGKTSLVERFLYDRFNENYTTTIGAAFGARYYDTQGKQVCVGVWDTAGSERYECMSRMYYRDSKAAIICYDISDENSAARAKFWVTQVRQNEEGCKIYLAGTKLDLVQDDRQARRVDYHDMCDYAEEVGAKVFETSSRTGENIETLFTTVVEDFAADHADVLATLKDSVIHLDNTAPRKRCC